MEWQEKCAYQLCYIYFSNGFKKKIVWTKRRVVTAEHSGRPYFISIILLQFFFLFFYVAFCRMCFVFFNFDLSTVCLFLSYSFEYPFVNSCIFVVWHLEINNECLLTTKLCDNRYDCSFLIVKFQFHSSKMPSALANCIHAYIFYLIAYKRACVSLLNSLIQGCCYTIKCYGRHHKLDDPYDISDFQITIKFRHHNTVHRM